MAGYNTIRGLRVKYLSADPANPEAGQVWYNSATGKLRVDGILTAGTWASGGAVNAAGTTASAGTQTANVIFAGQRPGNVALVEEYNGSSWTTVNSRPYAAGTAMGSGIQTAALNYGGNPASRLTTTVSYDGTNWSAESAMATARSMGGGSPSGTSSAALATTGGSGTTTEEFTAPSGTSNISSS